MCWLHIQSAVELRVPLWPFSSFWHQTLQVSASFQWLASLGSLTVRTSGPSSGPEGNRVLCCITQTTTIPWERDADWAVRIWWIPLTLPRRDLKVCLISCLWALLLCATMSMIASSSVPEDSNKMWRYLDLASSTKKNMPRLSKLRTESFHCFPQGLSISSRVKVCGGAQCWP